jgi:hypothetical protein
VEKHGVPGRMIRALAVFLAVAVSDIMWTRYIIHASSGASFPAASYAAGIVVVGAFVTLAYVRDRIYIIPAVLGAFVGTYLSV